MTTQAQSGAANTSAYYDAYLAELQQHATNQARIGQGAVDQLAQSTAGIRNLDNAQTAQQQAAMQADAASRGATVSPDLAAMANAASTTRQGLSASFGAQQAGVNAANVGYADTKAHVVGPGQKLTAQSNAQKVIAAALADQGTLAQKKGLDLQNYKTSAITDEGKNVLAKQALGLNVSKAQAGAELGAARIKETHRSTTVREQTAAQSRQDRLNSPSAQKTAADLAFFKQHGYYPPTGPPKPAKGPGSKTAAAQAKQVAANDKIRLAIDNAAQNARFLSTQKVKDASWTKDHPVLRSPTDAELRAQIRGQYKDADVANAALDLLRHGKISPENVRRLQLRHIGIPAKWLPKVKATGSLSNLAASGPTISKTPPIPPGG